MEKITIDRKAAPPIVDAVDFDIRLKEYEFYELDNGVPVYAVNAGAEDVLQVELVFFAGNSYEKRNLVAATCNYLLKNGTSKRSAFEINELVDYYGAHLNRACYNETATLTLHCLGKQAGELMPLMAELITDSIFPEEELKIFRQNSRQRLEVNLKKCEFVAGRLIDSYLYGQHHPYGKYTSLEEYDGLQRDELVEHFNQYYLQGECILFVAGKLPAGLPQMLNQHFGKLSLKPGRPATFPHHPIKPLGKPGEPIRIENDENGIQGAIRMATNFPNRHHPDFQKVMVLNTIFGGYFGSRLMANIREEKGYTYGIYSYIQNHIKDSAWMIMTEAGKDVCEPAIAEVYREMSLLREELVDAGELQLVKNYMMGSILGDLDGPFQIISRWKNLVLNGLDEDYFYRGIETIRTISAPELRDLARKYLDPSRFYELVVV